jgi:hypothetical protein
MFSQSKPTQEKLPLLSTQISITKSCIHAAAQTAGRDINDALGISNPVLLDDFLKTDAGKAWLNGFRQYAIHALAKTT